MLFVYDHMCTKALIWAKPPPNYKVHNERVVGGNNAAPNTWKWQVGDQKKSESTDMAPFLH